ncbi:hypothetical protein ABTP40_19060, partial [Acinetobacter baumannii]
RLLSPGTPELGCVDRLCAVRQWSFGQLPLASIKSHDVRHLGFSPGTHSVLTSLQGDIERAVLIGQSIRLSESGKIMESCA